MDEKMTDVIDIDMVTDDVIDIDMNDMVTDDVIEANGKLVDAKFAKPQPADDGRGSPEDDGRGSPRRSWQPTRSPSPDRGQKENTIQKLFVGGLSDEISTEVLTTYFERYGRIIKAVAMEFPKTKRPRGFGFVEFSDMSSINDVLADSPHLIDGCSVHVDRCLPRASSKRKKSAPSKDDGGEGRGPGGRSFTYTIPAGNGSSAEGAEKKKKKKKKKRNKDSSAEEAEEKKKKERDNDSSAEEAEENETQKSDNDSSAEEAEEKETKKSDNDSSAEDDDPSAEKKETKKRSRETHDGIKAKRKKKEKGPTVKSMKIKKFIHPRNAIVCLNELCKSVQYNKEQNGGLNKPFAMTVEIGDKKYRGFGNTKNIAKATAAEAALSTYVKPVPPTEEDRDETPWASLASFGIYKLFHMWLHGRIGMGPHPPIENEPYGGPASAFPLVTGANDEKIGRASNADNFTAHLNSFVDDGGSHLDDPPKDGGSHLDDPPKKREGKMPNPLKDVPDNAANMHPVMLLHHMNPGRIQYDITKLTTEGIIHFAITCNVDGHIFTGEGGNIRKAKVNLAKTAILEMYGVENVFEVPASTKSSSLSEATF